MFIKIIKAFIATLSDSSNTRCDKKVRELSNVCLPWQHWKKALVWLDDVDISAFQSCVVVDLWQSLSELASITVCVCFGVPPRECRSLY